MKITNPKRIFLVECDLENMKTRRNLSVTEIEDILAKKRLQDLYMRNNFDSLLLINNNRPLVNSMNDILLQVNKDLCTFNL